MAVRAVLDGDPQPQAVFDREHDEREDLDGDEGRRVTPAEFRHRFERDRDQVDQDQQHQRAVDGNAQPIAHQALLEDQIDAVAQFLDLVACACGFRRELVEYLYT